MEKHPLVTDSEDACSCLLVAPPCDWTQLYKRRHLRSIFLFLEMLPMVTFWNSLKATSSSIVTLPIYNYRILPNSLSQIQKNKFSMATPVLENLDFTWKKTEKPGRLSWKMPHQVSSANPSPSSSHLKPQPSSSPYFNLVKNADMVRSLYIGQE